MKDLFDSKEIIKLKRRSGILIPNKYKDTTFYSLVRAHLTRSSRDYQTEELVISKFFLESDKYLLIPRFFPIHDYITDYEIEDLSNTGQDIIINHNITPRSETQKKTIEHMLKNENCLIQLNPGVGKTVISIAVVATLKKKTFILAHKDYLVDQWISRFLEFTDLQKKEVVRLTSDNFQDSLKRSIIVTTTQTFTSLLKRNRNSFLTGLHSSGIGIFIGDEVHTSIGAPVFSECSIHIPARRTYGLSATPYRWDGNGDIINYHMGPLFSDDDSEGTMDAKVSVILFDFEIVKGTVTKKNKVIEIDRTRYLWWDEKFQRSRYLNLFKGSKPLNEVSKNLISKFKDRNILFMGERIDKFLKPLFDWCPDENKGLFISGKGNEDLQKRKVFTTPGKCRDGVDAPDKDLLIMTSPISNITQVVGRVTRSKEGKQTPIIIDLCDIGCQQISKTFFSRLDYYDSKKWEVQFFMIKDGKIEKIEREHVMKIL